MTDKPIEEMSPEEAAKAIEDRLCYLHRLPKDSLYRGGQGIVDIIKAQRQAAVAEAKNEALSEDLDKMTKRCLFAEQQWRAFKQSYEEEKAKKEALERDIAKLKVAICDDGSITDVDELVGFCEDLNKAYNKSGIISEIEARADKAEAQAAEMRILLQESSGEIAACLSRLHKIGDIPKTPPEHNDIYLRCQEFLNFTQ